MAIFHKNLKYHEDTIEKHPLSKDDKAFLIDLQKELNTQDTTATADPRFWVIAQTQRIYHMNPKESYGWELVNTDKGNSLIDNDEDALIEFLNKKLLPDMNRDAETEYHAAYNRYMQIELSDKSQKGLTYHDMEGIQEFLSEYFFERYEVIYYEDWKNQAVNNTLFLTEKDAAEHLKTNHYHYKPDAHTYCMCANSSPTVERLWKILQETDWNSQEGTNLSNK